MHTQSISPEEYPWHPLVEKQHLAVIQICTAQVIRARMSAASAVALHRKALEIPTLHVTEICTFYHNSGDLSVESSLRD